MNACTLFPDRFGSYDLTAACLLHDEDYATHQGFIASNFRLFVNATKASNMFVGLVMLAGTSILGWPWYIAAR